MASQQLPNFKQFALMLPNSAPSLELTSRGDGNGSFVLRFRPPGAKRKSTYTLTTGAKSVVKARPDENGFNGLDALYRRANQILKLLREAVGLTSGETVFPDSKGQPMNRQNPTKAFAALATGLGIHDLTFHDTRHIVGTNLARLGIPVEVRQRILHHITARKASPTTDIYDEYDYLAEKREALVRWQARLLAIVDDKPRLNRRRIRRLGGTGRKSESA